MIQVTQFQNAKTATGPVYRDAVQILDEIKRGKYRLLIEQLNTYPKDSQEQKAFKTSKLPGVCFAGMFEVRNDEKLLQHSGLVAVDFDHLPQDEYERHWQTLKADKHTFALFRSPRRDGIKCIVRITASAAHHRALVRGLRRYYSSAYYDHFDDPSRLCFVSWDPELYLNENAVEFREMIDEPRENNHVISRSNPVHTGETATEAELGIFRMILKWETNRGRLYQDGAKHKYLVSVFTALNRFGVRRFVAIDLVRDHFIVFPGVEFVRAEDFERLGQYIYNLYASAHNTQQFAPARRTVNEAKEETEPRPRFPIEVLPDDCQAFINELNRTLKYNRDFLAISMLFVFATVNGNKYKLRVKNGWIAPTVFWFMAVGEPGTMKTHPLGSIIRPLSQIDKASKQRYDMEMDEWNRQEQKAKKPRFNQILLSDYTIEALHEVHAYNKRGLGLYKDEIVGFLNDMNKYRKGSDEQFWLESFNNSSYQINRVSKEPIRLDDIMINVIGSIQPLVLSKVAKDYAGNGLIDRFLYTAAELEIYPMGTDDINQEWFEWWTSVVMRANDLFDYRDTHDGVILEMTDDAMAEMIATDAEFVRMQTSDEETNEIKTYLSKMKTYLPRFALIIALMDTLFTGIDAEVTGHHFRQARLVCDYFIRSARAVFTEAETAQEIANVRKAKATETKADQILHLSGKGFKNSEIAKALKTPASYVSKVIQGK